MTTTSSPSSGTPPTESAGDGLRVKDAGAFLVSDPDPDRLFQFFGRPEGDLPGGGNLDRLARRYLGRDRYPDSYRFPGERRRIYRIAPERVTAWDPFG